MTPWILQTGIPAGELSAHEGQTLMYLAGIALDSPPPEEPCIGSGGPQSRALTQNLIFQLYLTGKLRPKSCGICRRIGNAWMLFRARWNTFFADEPPPQRRTRPSLFPAPYDATPVDDFAP